MNAKLCARRAALLAIVLAAPAGAAWAGFIDNRPAPAVPAVAAPAAAGAGAVATPVGSAGAPNATPPAAEPATGTFKVQPGKEKNLREVLASWATLVGWTFDVESWTVPYDHPVRGFKDFGSDFKTAVRGVLVATDLTDIPLQPCFYSNKVLRVVPKAELCDKNPS